MVYTNYELKAYLSNLTLSGQDIEGDLLWVGEKLQWAEAEMQINKHEQYSDDN